MTVEDLERIHSSFLAFHNEFAPLFGRRECRENSQRYLRSLLVLADERSTDLGMAR